MLRLLRSLLRSSLGKVLALVKLEADLQPEERYHGIGRVGLSIALFFLLLAALSEQLSWQVAAASHSVLLLALCFSAVLQGLGPAAFVAYGALYGLLASESNAPLLGALPTFGMLSLLVLATRRVQWHALSRGRDKTPALSNL